MTTLQYVLFDSAIGVCGLAWSDVGVARFQLPEATPAATQARVARAAVACDQVSGDVQRVVDGVRRHLAGELDDLRWIAVDTRRMTAWDRAVYDATRQIDPGDTLTYGELAERVGSPGSAQAVGQAMGRNPVPVIIPCHRVLAAGAKLHGFSAHGGVFTKRRLLTIEHASGFDDPVLFQLER